MAGLLDHQSTRTHARAAGANSRHVTRRDIVCSSVSRLFFQSSFFVDHEVAVSTRTHKAQKRIYADGLDIDHRLAGGTDTAREGLVIQMLVSKYHREIYSWRGGPEKCIAATCHFPTPATAEHTQNWQHDETCARMYMRLHT